MSHAPPFDRTASPIRRDEKALGHDPQWLRSSSTCSIPFPTGSLSAFIFDVIYDRSAEVLWFKAAAWLIAMGLPFAVLPRLINLVRVWFPQGRPRVAGEMFSFWLYLPGDRGCDRERVRSQPWMPTV
jgi:hypothetical protein